jgi:hypothetical protein
VTDTTKRVHDVRTTFDNATKLVEHAYDEKANQKDKGPNYGRLDEMNRAYEDAGVLIGIVRAASKAWDVAYETATILERTTRDWVADSASSKTVQEMKALALTRRNQCALARQTGENLQKLAQDKYTKARQELKSPL